MVYFSRPRAPDFCSKCTELETETEGFAGS
jgi:hypothetical protein